MLTRVLQPARKRFALTAVRHGGSAPLITVPPPPPLEYEEDGTPRKYPLYQPIYNHNYTWENWTLMPAGVFHTVYFGDLAKDCSPYQAWIQSYPFWVGTPVGLLAIVIAMNFIQNAGSIGIKPKRYTLEWIEASKERERVENNNPVTRYHDRRRAERGMNFVLGDYLPYHPSQPYIKNAHDWEYLEEKGKTAEEMGR